MTFETLESYISFLKRHDRLIEVRDASRERDIGGLTELAVHNRPSPALLFEDIPEYPAEYRVLSNAVTTPFQWSAAMGFEPTTSKREAVLRARENSSISELIPPRTVENGQILENIDRNAEVDVTRFPAPVWHENDGGPYIGTGDLVVTRNADTGAVNAGVYRIQVHGPKKVTVYTIPGKDGHRNVRSFLDQGKPCPVVASVGHPVDLFLSACERTSSNVNEFEYMGGRRGEPVDVVEGEVTGLPIPADSELVLEGHIYPDDEPVVEGPFGEWTGYYASGENDVVPLTIERVYHQDEPIILGKPPIRPPAQILAEIKSTARLWDELEEAGIPGIENVNTMPFGPGWFEVVSISQQYAGHSTQVGTHLASGPEGGYFGRFKVVVDDDIDPFDLQEVMWAITSRCDPASDIHLLEDCWSSPIDPLLPPEKQQAKDITNSQAIIDATRPYHWRDEFPPVNEASEELETYLFNEWGDLLASEILPQPEERRMAGFE